jgi:RND family efflux transporter MFP subunit
MMMNVIRRMRTTTTVIAVGLVLLVGSGAIFGLVRYTKRKPDVPVFEVKRSEFLDVIQFRGDVKATKSITIAAPSEAGDLQILKIAADGSQVKRGDVVVEFDKSKTEQDLAMYKSALKSADAEIEQVRAQNVLKEEEDLTAVRKAEFDVETAKLEASKKEIVSQIDAQEANLKLADAEQKLHEMQVKLKSDQALDKAAVDSKKQASKKAEYDVELANHSLATMSLRAPSTGMLSLIAVWHGNNDLSPLKVGDRAWPGAPIAEMPDAASLVVSARVDETERGRLALQQPVTVQLDAIPERQFTGRLKEISTIATSDFSGGWPFPRNFNLQIALDQQDARLRPGMTAQSTVVVDRMPAAITIPTQAMFQKSGQTLAYVWDGSKFREQAIAVGRTSRDRILVTKGLNAGDRVAMKDPTFKE